MMEDVANWRWRGGAPPSDAESVAIGRGSVPGFRDMCSASAALGLRYSTVPALRRARSLMG